MRSSRAAFVAAAVGGLALASMAVPAEGVTAAKKTDMRLLWSTTAPTAKIAKQGGHYLVTMPGSSPTAWFTDRPHRQAGSTTLQGFVGGWQQNRYDKVPPNAALVLTKQKTVTQTVVKLTKPKEKANGTIRFRADILPGGQVMDMTTLHKTMITGKYRNAEMFIDSGDAPPCAAMITQPGWCTLTSSNYDSASTTVDLETPNAANTTRTVQSCYWTGDHKLDVLVHYREIWSDDLTLTLDHDSTPNCNSPSFSNLNQSSATWRFAPVNTYYLNGAFRFTRNKTATFTLHSRSASYGGLWRFYSTPKVVIVVSDS